MYIGEPLHTAVDELGKPAAVVFRGTPGYAWRQSDGLVITVLTAPNGWITLIDVTAAPPDQPTGILDEDSTETGFTLNQSSRTDLNLKTQPTHCKGNFGADCWAYQYDGNLVMRADFAPNGKSDGVLREITLAHQPLLQQLHFDE
jgi:hypothetical protein